MTSKKDDPLLPIGKPNHCGSAPVKSIFEDRGSEPSTPSNGSVPSDGAG